MSFNKRTLSRSHFVFLTIAGSALIVGLLCWSVRIVSGGEAAPATQTSDSVIRPQYVFLNRAPGSGPDRWNQSNPEGFTPESLRKIVDTVGTRGNRELRIGVTFVFSILEGRLDTTAESLRRMLKASEAADVPVLIGLDGENWWETRPDLWNWWDESLPGYNLANRMNVEWTGWGPKHAVKIGWRNWGQQVRVRPAPNLASPKFLAEHWKAYDVLIPLARDWYRKLPPQRRYLFGGIKVGWEASINVNAFYQADGNRIAENPQSMPAGDPQHHDISQGWTFGNPPLGYAAVATEGIRKSGTLTRDDIELVVKRYLARLAHAARQRGIPRELIFTHQGGTYQPWDRHLSFRAAINDDSIPGWSFYSHDPAECGSLGADLDAAGQDQWAAAEWWRGGSTPEEWKQHFNASLKFKKCRMVCVFNWEGLREDAAGLRALRKLAE